MLQERRLDVNFGKQIYKREGEHPLPSEMILRSLARGGGSLLKRVKVLLMGDLCER